MGQYYTSNNFFMEINSDEDLDFARRYTKSTCNPCDEDLFELSKNFIVTKNSLKFENNKFVYRVCPTGEDIELSQDEANRLIGCICVCDKIKINNWARYCDKNCPYYFNTKNLQKIILRIDEE